MPGLLALIHIGDMHLDHRSLNSCNGIGNSHRSMGVSAGVHNDTVDRKTYFMQFIDNFALHIALIIVESDVWVAFAELFKIAFKTCVAVDRFLANAKEVQIGAVDN